MKTPTVDDPKPKRDSLGPTGPAKVSDDNADKTDDTNMARSAADGDSSYESELENILHRNVRRRRRDPERIIRTRAPKVLLEERP